MSLLTFKNIIRGLAFIFIVSACQENEKKEISNPLYFDINQVINRQINLLDSLKPELKKSLTINDVTEEKIATQVDWERELKIFKEADINSPILRETFKITESKVKGSTTISYLPLKDINKGVVQLTIAYSENKKLESIYCKIISDNWLYSFERILNLKFSNEKNLELLQGFSIKNSQDVLFKKKDRSNLKANIISSF